MLLVALPLALVACGKKPADQTDLDRLDNELTAANQSDPAMTAAVRGQIMVDPGLTQSSNEKSIRPPSRPDPNAIPPDGIGAKPDGVDPATLKPAPAARDCPDCRAAAGALTLGELAKRQKNASIAHCAGQLGYSATWAARLPADVPLYPDARVAEAAGAQPCGLRVVSFATAAPVTRVIDWYYTKTHNAGYAAEHQRDGAQHVLGGTRGDAAYVIYVSPRAGGGSDVDLVTNQGS
ncbi:hypothetical protein EAH84_11750 [Sphingomonas oligophenolica]|uniref:Uncharacterized protein n=1 Tax=Sphingomonas oligophenolica TaxID=301154 RepID=A0A502CGX6_9SPHN|nr:hypothetical protein EAH84_11750 [Sphingomonas oligophenolica]